MQTIQEKILIAGCLIVLMTASVLGVIWLRKFMQPKPEAARTEQYITVQRDAELYEAFVRATIGNLRSETVTNWSFNTNGLVFTNTTPAYGPGKPDRWGMAGTQDRYIDWPYPPLKTNLTQYHLIPNHGILWMYFCNDGQIRWEFKPQKP